MLKKWLNRIVAHAEQNPHAMAIVACNGTLTYLQLLQRARAIASRLTESESLRQPGLPSDPRVVAIFCKRETELVSALLGVMLAGHAYTIVEDEGALDEHLNRLVDMAPDLVLCPSAQLSKVEGAGLMAVSVDVAIAEAKTPIIAAPPSEGQAAYVLYTSGSTGKPKGVVITHDNIDHYTQGLDDRLRLPTGLNYAHVSTLAADLGNTCLLLALWSGGTLHVVGSDIRKDPGALCEYLVQHKIDVLKITPSHWRAVMAARRAESSLLRCLLLGGEALPVSLAEQILNEKITQRLVNHYGPTEATVGVTIYPVDDLPALRAMGVDVVPIGRPFGDTILRIRDEKGEVREHGTGELFIGGPQVATGYIRQIDLTQKAFCELPGCGAERFYSSGDLVRIDNDGWVHFLGRVDRQVKVSGYRVELEHVEAALRSLPGVAEAVVLFPKVQGKNRLVAVLAPRGTPEDIDVWLNETREALKSVLPSFMLPQRWYSRVAFERNTNGKVDLKQIGLWLDEQLGQDHMQDISIDNIASSSDEGVSADDGLAALVRGLFIERLQLKQLNDNDDFFEFGGDSLDAIQVIAELQAGGHNVSTQTFAENPTVAGLVAMLRAGAEEVGTQPTQKADGSRANAFSSAQNFFLQQPWEDPDHYNQAVLLECGDRIDADALSAALRELVRNHPLLRTAFRPGQSGPAEAQLLTADSWDGFRISHPSTGNDAKRVQGYIEHVAMRTQRAIRIDRGDVFKVHLFKFGEAPDRLLLVAHHLVVDMVAWRVLIFELSRMYADLLHDGETRLAPCAASFWDWVDHVDTSRGEILDRAQAWLTSAEPEGGWRPIELSQDNTERNARTLWLGFGEAETRRLQDEVVVREGIGMHQLLLGIFAYIHARQTGISHLDVEVESHGRIAFEKNVDISRVIGWHTSTYPVRLRALDIRLPSVLRSCRDQMEAVPDLGMAFWHSGDSERPLPLASICYNYLGEIDFSHDERVDWNVSSGSLSRARGDHNHRLHDIKISARTIRGRLVIDISFPGKSNFNAMVAAVQAMKDIILQLCEGDESGARIVLESGTRTGMLTYVPSVLLSEDSGEKRRTYRALLLTGVTGFIGIHVLRDLLEQFDGQIYCLVRSKNGSSPVERLAEAWSWYFDGVIDAEQRARITVLEGDTTAERFGLSERDYDDLAMRVDAIYHFAADTRLFGVARDFERANVKPVQSCIDLAMYGRRKDFHYMSTLAVCGINKSHSVYDFSEEDLNYGQEFQNGYEHSKYLAESLVKSFVAGGGRGYIYRSGNVSGHSVTGKFQRNAKDNRLIQLLSACAKLGRLPRDVGEPVVLSPVDEVSAGIVALSLDLQSSGGVFHVDGVQAIDMADIFAALQFNGVCLSPSDHVDLQSLFREVADSRDPYILLGCYWANRAARRVRYRNERTHRLMKRLGREFSPLDDSWLNKLIVGLIEQGVFAEASIDITA